MSVVIRVLVGSKNPVKVGAAYKAFSNAFPDHAIHCEGVNAPSKVADQPMTEKETRIGAENRTAYCEQSDSADDYHYYVAMEGGVDKFAEGPSTFAYVSIRGKHGDNWPSRHSVGRSANLPLPQRIFDRLKAGEELGHVMDDVFNQTNIKQKGGAIGLLTNHLATRESIYIDAITLALAPYFHPEHYQ
ncbi:inosine/xanthosine triphosphatase [Marinomonas mediterranea]|uniref:Inosine/xanthosine triphosphatase n=1 Tax=Marinomonas mediterranea (strain ATCC 700492 / JCM 21426 / NBRC 103028 / MMB-1) TaxID=717774 RepID=F2JTG5_MARM1|nr:inosine/xanthosine triphosphatase [Marinomonas mediterranea]ADZ91479.1 protein of unknown function DUF84 [Marinomonas mediterranea MMB-1]WCN09446.1 non-canonical purine NTP phosphatase [Marinomonas mediterranea]WCN13522.1 non-canonical purine NTP phosphatase [Marinomonas mediterranea]WCN17588.1 non-canonical purine NTP phosphatase [Marinomonas mediterranea MMB-1]